MKLKGKITTQTIKGKTPATTDKTAASISGAFSSAFSVAFD